MDIESVRMRASMANMRGQPCIVLSQWLQQPGWVRPRPGAWDLALHRVFPRGGRGPGTWSSSAAFPDTLAGCCIGVEQPGLGVVPVWMPALRQRLDLLEQCRPLNFTQGLARASRSPFFSLSSCCLSALVSRAGGSTLLTRLQQLPLIETCRGRVVQPRSHLPRNPVD